MYDYHAKLNINIDTCTGAHNVGKSLNYTFTFQIYSFKIFSCIIVLLAEICDNYKIIL